MLKASTATTSLKSFPPKLEWLSASRVNDMGSSTMIKHTAQWWRGYDDNDVASLRIKLNAPGKPHEIIWLTSGEAAALRLLVKPELAIDND